ncbi:MAG: hypothetical protein IT212_07490 [Bacteroidia bacterium]|nr:hypothetical protein [Bacteroidia bacterium]
MGDNYYTLIDIKMVDVAISAIEEKIKSIDNDKPQTNSHDYRQSVPL